MAESLQQPPASPTSVPRALAVPAVVGIVVAGLVLLLHWMTATEGVDALLGRLERGGNDRWRAAAALAAAMGESAAGGARLESAQAQRVLALVRRETGHPRPDDEQLKLQVYLVRLLRQVPGPESLEAAIELAACGGAGRSDEVRLAAVEAIAASLPAGEPPTGGSRAALEAALESAASAGNPRLRGAAAFAWGVWGTAAAEARLVELLGDPQLEVRANAATGLARRGNAACLEVLVEMLDVRRIERQRAAESPQQRLHQQTIVANALRAAARLAERDPHSDLGRLAAAVRRLYVADVDAATLVEATGVLKQLEARAAAAGARPGDSTRRPAPRGGSVHAAVPFVTVG